MTSATVPAGMLCSDVAVMTSGGPRIVTWAGAYVSWGMQMWGWRWTPAPRPDGLLDCGYSGIAIEEAGEHLVALA